MVKVVDRMGDSAVIESWHMCMGVNDPFFAV